ncbi:MAG: spermidine synthase [Betaproteobacteria bacterium]|nr:MAG: spermidine synthase [Betaproteobacteria bacterium]
MKRTAVERLARHVFGNAPALTVSEARGVRTLHVGGEAVQSAMRLDDPHALALDYTRCMMAFLLFHPEPREVLMIGLGGGSLAKFMHRNLRAARTRVVELDQRIVAVARSLFHLPPDDARLAVEIGDGAEALSAECADVLLVDGFDDESLPGTLVSQAFFDAAWGALAGPGVLAMNLMSDDPRLDRVLRRMEAAFGGAVLCMPALSDPNVIAFALKGAPTRFSWQALRARAGRLQARHGLPFARYVNQLRRMNPCDAHDLIAVPSPAA